MAVSRASDATSLYRNDGDHDQADDLDGDNYHDTEHDAFLDYKPDENGRYHDPDDNGILTYGRSASAGELRDVTNMVKRYYAIAAAGDGVTACALLRRNLAESVPTDYGESDGAASKSCGSALTQILRRHHAQLAIPVVVTGVRVSGNEAYALLGSRLLEANFILLQREGKAWKMAQLLASENRLP